MALYAFLGPVGSGYRQSGEFARASTPSPPLSGRMMERGVHPAVASKTLGHASEAFTMTVYGHVRDEMLEQTSTLTVSDDIAPNCPDTTSAPRGSSKPSTSPADCLNDAV